LGSIRLNLFKDSAMQIKVIKSNKKRFLDLLLLADEQESMIDTYLHRGEMFALYADDLKSIGVVTRESDNVFEIKNLATYEKYQGQGYGGRLLKYFFERYGKKGKTMLVGTGDYPPILSFYEHYGFRVSHIVKNFFVENYDHPIYENGTRLIDMVYLKKEF